MPLHEELEAIDATLRGEAVDPEFAELAELSLLLAMTRPEVPVDRAASLDRRFATLTAEPGRVKAVKARRPLIFRPAFGAGLAGVVAVAGVIVATSGNGGPSQGTHPQLGKLNIAAGAHVPAGVKSPASARSAPAQDAANGTVAGTSSGSSGSSVGGGGLPDLSSTQSPQLTSAGTSTFGAAQNGIAVPAPSSRKTIQSSQLSLTTPAGRIGTVSQEVYNVVGSEQGIVERSSVTSAGGGSTATFSLEIPASSLQATLARLQQLKYATVASATGTTQDVNSQYQDDLRALADARALRVSLLKQLANAQTSTAVESIKAQIQTAEATIASDEGALNALNGKVAYSKVSVQISPSGPVQHHRGTTHRGTLGQALHTALHVLAVIAAVLLVALAIILPVGIVGSMVWWVTQRRRRHLRDRALDGA